jgi:hypothetical protein
MAAPAIDATLQAAQAARSGLSGLLEQAPPADEVVTRSRIGLWEFVRTAVATAIAALRLVVRLLDRASSFVAVAEQRGEELGTQLGGRAHDLGERARDVAHQLPPSRRARRRNRLRLVGVAGASFGAGAAVGYLLASRQGQTVVYEPAGVPVHELAAVEPLPGQDSLEPEAQAEEHVATERVAPDEASR